MRGVTLTKALFVINLPQLLLSLIHIFYNNLSTRLHMGKEWARMSTKYKGLRVTDPKGHQKATHRLQIPYRYSIPLIMTNLGLHILLSTALYIFISEGDYYEDPLVRVQPNPSLPPGAGISVGVSFTAALIVAGLLILLSTSSLYSAFKHIPESTPVVGCNSFAIAAACHISPLARPDPGLTTISGLPTRQQNDESDIELKRPASIARSRSAEDYDGNESMMKRKRISQSRLQWGVVEMPTNWHEIYKDFKNTVGHMSFGTVQNDIYKPIEGRYYV
jgi:hypothetical protein